MTPATKTLGLRLQAAAHRLTAANLDLTATGIDAAAATERLTRSMETIRRAALPSARS